MKKQKKEKLNSHEKIFKKILTDNQFRQQVVRESFEFFFPIYLSQYMTFESAPFHKEIFNILEDEKIKLAVIVAFRGSAKSTIITTAYVLWSILGVQKYKLIIICGQTEQKARQHLQSIKNELLENKLLKKDLGPFEEEKNSLGNATALIIKRLNVKIMICSTGQSIRGMRHNEYRPNLIIFDDIEDTDSVRTKEGRDKTFNWLTSEIIPSGNENTRLIFVGNLLHEDSVLKRLQKRIKDGEMDSLNAVFRQYPIFDDDGKPTWPGRFPTTESVEIERQKIMDEVVWSREFLLKIISSDEQIVKPEWIQYYERLPIYNKIDKIILGVDLAISEKESADYTAIVVAYLYGYGKNLKIYIQPNPINSRMSCPALMTLLKGLINTQKENCYKVKTYIENNGYQQALVQLLETQKVDVEGCYTGYSDKAARLRLTTSFIENGKILFPKEGCEELIEQLVGFGKETHDDLADAFSILILKVMEKNNIHRGSAGLFGPNGGNKI